MPNDEKASRCNAVARRGGGNEILILGKISLFVEMAGTLAQCLGIGAEGLFGQRSSPPAEKLDFAALYSGYKRYVGISKDGLRCVFFDFAFFGVECPASSR
jgi:hypothetical protein